MIVKGYKTHKIQPNESIFTILDTYLPKIEEKSIVAIASKVVGICEGRVVKKESDEQKDELAKQEADLYLSREFNQYGYMITINRNLMVASAGIDESNSNGFYSLWPKDPQKSVNDIRNYLIKKHKLTYIGVILTDSRLSPLRWGVTGASISYSGFHALNSYINKPDIYGQKMRAERANMIDSLATAAVIEMGEGNEQRPLALITEMSLVRFQKRNPTQKELDALHISMEDDIYASLLTRVDWKKGKKKS